MSSSHIDRLIVEAVRVVGRGTVKEASESKPKPLKGSKKATTIVKWLIKKSPNFSWIVDELPNSPRIKRMIARNAFAIEYEPEDVQWVLDDAGYGREYDNALIALKL